MLSSRDPKSPAADPKLEPRNYGHPENAPVMVFQIRFLQGFLVLHSGFHRDLYLLNPSGFLEGFVWNLWAYEFWSSRGSGLRV